MGCRDQAKWILTAWSQGDRVLVGRLAQQNPDTRNSAEMASEEAERRELLDGIKARLSQAGSNSKDPAVAVSLRLLKHLAAARN